MIATQHNCNFLHRLPKRSMRVRILRLKNWTKESCILNKTQPTFAIIFSPAYCMRSFDSWPVTWKAPSKLKFYHTPWIFISSSCSPVYIRKTSSKVELVALESVSIMWLFDNWMLQKSVHGGVELQCDPFSPLFLF